MNKISAILLFLSGLVFALIGVFVMVRAGAFLSAAPRDHDGLVAWAVMILIVGICLFIGGLGYVRLGANELHGPEMPEDF